jgi:hypothetical protein
MLLGERPAPRPAGRQQPTVITGPRADPVATAPSYDSFDSRDSYDSYDSRDEPPARGGRRRGHRTLATLAVLLVLAGVATVAFVLNTHGRAGNPLATGSQRNGGAAAGAPEPTRDTTRAPAPEDQAPQDQAPDTQPPTTPADYAEQTPVEPEGGEPIIQDPLNEPGQWLDSEIREQNANCVTRGVMQAVRVDRGTYQCVGPDESIEDDVGIEVTTALQSAGSCAAIWFHWNPRAGGQVLRVCQNEISVAADMPDNRRVYGRIPLDRQDRRIALRQPARIHLVLRDGQAEVFRGGYFEGAVRLPSDGPDEGQVLLGLSAEAVNADPPYAVTFADVDIRSL